MEHYKSLVQDFIGLHNKIRNAKWWQRKKLKTEFVQKSPELIHALAEMIKHNQALNDGEIIFDSIGSQYCVEVGRRLLQGGVYWTFYKGYDTSSKAAEAADNLAEVFEYSRVVRRW